MPPSHRSPSPALPLPADPDTLQRVGGIEGRAHRPKPVGCSLCAFTIPQQSLRAEGTDPRRDGFAGHRLSAAPAALMRDVADQRSDRRLLPCAIDAPDGFFDEGFPRRVETTGSFYRG